MINRSYRIWFSQRNGSTLLSMALEQTGVAGKPKELFNINSEESMCSHYNVSDYNSLKEKLWEEGSTDNGIMAVKNCLYTSRYQQILSELKNLTKHHSWTDTEIWDDLFPNCKHIFMTRRNKLRQTISWWKAINDGIWHKRDKSINDNDAALKDRYDPNALDHLLRETVLRECAIQDYFSSQNVQPLTVVYEDFVGDYEGTIRRILDFIDVDHSEIEIKDPPLQKTANEFSEIWVQQFREELQQGWDKIIW